VEIWDIRFSDETFIKAGEVSERKVSLGEIIDFAYKKYKVRSDEIISRDRSWSVSKLRTLIGHLLVEYGEENMSDFARYKRTDEKNERVQD